MPTTPPYTPHAIRLMGHRNLGTVKARWLGCILELDDGTRYGPCAVFDAMPLPDKQPMPVEPASLPSAEEVPKLRHWIMSGAGWWLFDVDHRTVAGCDASSWWAQPMNCDRSTGPETGLLGKEKATKALLDAGYKWVSDKSRNAYRDLHGIDALGCFDRGDKATMVDRKIRTVAQVIGGRDGLIAFQDGTWMDYREAEQQIAARIPGDDDIPF